MPVQKKIAAVVLADLRGYSRMSEAQLKRFFSKLLPQIAETITRHQPFQTNSWGDAYIAAFDDAEAAATCALDIRDLFSNANWSQLELPALAPRISLHSGPVFVGQDPFSGQTGIIGTQVNLVSRVEPITLPGHVWATDNFVSLLSQYECPNLAWDDLGERPLAKEWGAKRLYRVRRAHESPDLPSLSAAAAGEEEHGATGLELCVHMLQMGTEDQKYVALDMLGSIDTPEAVAALVTAARQKTLTPRMRLMALASLAELKNPTCVRDLTDIVMDADEPRDITGAAIEVLGALGDPAAVPTLIAVVTSDEPRLDHRIKGLALISLGRMRLNSQAIDAVASILASGDHELLEPATAAAGLLGDARLALPLADIAADTAKTSRLRGAALEALASTGVETHHEGLLAGIALSQDDHPEVRRRAMLLLGALGTATADRTLKEVASRLDDPLSADALRCLFKAEKLVEGLKKELKKV